MVHVETDIREHAYDTTIVYGDTTVTQTRVYGSDWWRWQIGENTLQWDSIEKHRAHIGLETTFQTAIKIQETARAVAGLQD